MLKKSVTKEDFKRYMDKCPKVAWIFHNLDHFKKAVNLKKQEIVEYHLDIEMENSEEMDENTTFDPLSLYEEILTSDDKDLDEIKLEQKKALQKLIDDTNGFELTQSPVETIVDGNAVGQAAREHFIEKLKIENIENNTNFEYYDFNNHGYKETLQLTEKILQDTNYKYLFEPSFELDDGNLKIRCDILINKGNRHLELVEVKASTSSKMVHFYDVMYQKYILEKLGYFVDEIYIGLVNGNYIRGRNIKKNQLTFVEREVPTDFEKEVLPVLNNIDKYEIICGQSDLDYQKVIKLTNQLENTAKRNNINQFIEEVWHNQPDFMEQILTDISESFKDHKVLYNAQCIKVKPSYAKNHLSLIKQPCKFVVDWYDKTKYNLYQLARFKDKAAYIHWTYDEVYIDQINDVFDPKYSKEEKSLFGPNEIRVIKAIQNYIKTNQLDSKYIIDEKKYDILLKVLSDYYKYPVYMYDFETVKWALPNYDNTWSYMQVPFQYSIHTILNDNYDFKKESTMKHYDFIADKQEDPRRHFIIKFIKDCFSSGPGIYVAYYKSFEKTVIKNLILLYPEFSGPLRYIHENTIDLRDFFALAQNNWLIYLPEFKGSSSIKKTQPGLDNSLTYKDLRINNGGKASQTFRQFLDNVISEQDFEVILKEDMLKYCNRDTLAMVVVLQKVVEIVKNYDPGYIFEIEKILKRRNK